MYCVKDDNATEEMPSIHTIYIELEDPTEYRIATEYFGGWEHWQKICRSTWFKPHLTLWREELEVKLRCEGIKKQLQLAGKGNVNAAKWVAEKGWTTKRKAGAPSKEETTRERKVQAKVADELEADYLRIVK